MDAAATSASVEASPVAITPCKESFKHYRHTATSGGLESEADETSDSAPSTDESISTSESGASSSDDDDDERGACVR